MDRPFVQFVRAEGDLHTVEAKQKDEPTSTGIPAHEFYQRVLNLKLSRQPGPAPDGSSVSGDLSTRHAPASKDLSIEQNLTGPLVSTELLQRTSMSSSSTTTLESEGKVDVQSEDDQLHCHICNVGFTNQEELKQHRLSMSHLLARSMDPSTLQPPTVLELNARSNKGYRMLVRSGWSEERGLGRQEEGN
jgi:hypothetical protein